ncbi:MAG: ATP-dependent DNA helicase [bacterium]
MKIELNPGFRRALELMTSGRQHLFVTGSAGTGKSTLLEYFRTHTHKRVVVLAPTGVAALNVRGETIHSFFRFKPDITVQKVRRLPKKSRRIYEQVETIVIDEISMVRADLLDCVDRFLRLNRTQPDQPFGGVQMIFIGDLYQLPPVVTAQEQPLFCTHYSSPYFFDADVFQDLKFEFVQLEKVYRQQDAEFIELLNQIRTNTITEPGLALLNSRVGVQLNPTADDFVVYLTTRNEAAARINNHYLARLPGKTWQFSATISGSFDRNSYPTDYLLTLKPGAQVMMLTNDPKGRWVNGTLGRVKDIIYDPDEDSELIAVQFQDRNQALVAPFTWEIFHFRYNEHRREIETEVLGTFTHYPLRLAWAVTIHKSQGKTFDRVIIDLGSGTFAPGQVYVALSRCTSFGGIALTRPVKKEHIFTDWRIVRFLAELHQRAARSIPETAPEIRYSPDT